MTGQPFAAQGRRLGFITFGCKVNQYESAFMAAGAANSGFKICSPWEAQLLVINTCTVTSRTDRQIRQILRQAARQIPPAKIIVTGCYAQRSPGDLAQFPNVQAIFGNLEKASWPDLLGAVLNREKLLVQVADLAGCRTFTPMPVQSFQGHTRAFVKIQDGCSHFCSYCIVPSVRGPERSLPIPEVLKQIQVLLAGGFKEIVLTGINLSRFGCDLPGDQNLLTLIRRLKQTTWTARFRLSSVEPQDLSLELLQELSTWPQFCPHFHVPMQSGAAAVLKAMQRNYQPDEFENLIRQINLMFPKAAVGLDVMVGFPTESPADFRQTRELLDRLPVSYLHVFPYSSRPGTPAAGWRPLVNSKEIHNRARDLRALGWQKKLAFCQRQVGQVAEVLVEGEVTGKSGWVTGLTENYLRVHLRGPRDLANQVIRVRLLKTSGQNLIGEIIA
jgi:threonylcarbamoyladenosine tRNA methylthiotransferase MtaB